MSDKLNTENSEIQQEELESSFNLRSILELTWGLRYWIILSVFIAMIAAAGYLYFKPKLYSSNIMVMVTNDKNAGMASSAELGFISDITGVHSFNSLVNEQVIIKSTPILQAISA